MKSNVLKSSKKDKYPWDNPDSWMFDVKYLPGQMYRKLIGRPLECIKRAFAFAKIGWGSYDWDHAYLLELELFKMRRILKVIENGHTDWEATDGGKCLKALRLAIKIGDRMMEGNYHKFYDLHHKKWGEREILWNDDTPFVNGSRPVKWNRECSEEESAELIIAFKIDERLEQRDYNLFYGIIAKYSRGWWS